MGGPWEDYQKAESGPWDDYTPSVPTTAQESPQPGKTFLGKVGESISKRAGNIASIYKPRPDEGDAWDSFTKSPGRILQTVGQVAGLVNDVAGAGIGSAVSAVTPDDLKDYLSEKGKQFVQTNVGKQIISGAGTVEEAYEKLKKIFPQGMKNIEAVVNIATTVPVTKLAKMGGSAAAETASAVKGAVTPMKTVEKLDELIDASIEKGIKKGIKPTVVGKSDAGLTQKYYDNAKTAVRDIVDMSDTPISKSENVLESFSQAVRNTKIKLWDQATAMSGEAGQKGLRVNLSPVLDDLEKLSLDDNIVRANPGMSAKIKELKEVWETKPLSQTPQEAEELVSMLNQQAKSFWRDPTMHTEAALYERMAQNLRKELYDTVESLKGEGYKDLRKRYGAQLAIEKEVTDRATQYGRRNEYGFFDLANIPAASAFAESLLSGSPVGMTKAAVILAAKHQMKKANDTSNIIRDMFSKVENYSGIKAKLTKVAPEPDISGVRPTPQALPMPERGFTLKGEPYGDDVINASYTSRTRPLLEQPRVDETKLLPAGQGFTFRDIAPSSAYSAELAKQLLPLLQRKALPAGQGFMLNNPLSEDDILKKILELRGINK